MNISEHNMTKELHSQSSSSTSSSTRSHSNNTINDIRSYYQGLNLVNLTREVQCGSKRRPYYQRY
jgi:hypothetical protein